MMGEGTTRNMQRGLQKYNKLYIVASRWTIIDNEVLKLSLELNTLRTGDADLRFDITTVQDG